MVPPPPGKHRRWEQRVAGTARKSVTAWEATNLFTGLGRYEIWQLHINCREVCPKENRKMGWMGKMKDLMATEEWGEKHRGIQDKTVKTGSEQSFFWHASLSSGVRHTQGGAEEQQWQFCSGMVSSDWNGSSGLHSSIFLSPQEPGQQKWWFSCSSQEPSRPYLWCWRYWMERWWIHWCDLHSRAVPALAGSWWRVRVTCLMQINLQTQTSCWESARAPGAGLYLGYLVLGTVFSKHLSAPHMNGHQNTTFSIRQTGGKISLSDWRTIANLLVHCCRAGSHRLGWAKRSPPPVDGDSTGRKWP